MAVVNEGALKKMLKVSLWFVFGGVALSLGQ